MRMPEWLQAQCRDAQPGLAGKREAREDTPFDRRNNVRRSDALGRFER
jgi:hypothetical protein